MSITASARHSRLTELPPVDAQTRDADIVVLAPRKSAEPHGREMDEEIAASWGLWSEQIGKALVPVLQNLASSLPSFRSAMICTEDGFNLCTLGIDEEQVSRLSAMTSSLHSIAGAVSSAVHDGDGGPMDMLSLTNGSSKTVVLAVRNLIVGQLLLWVTVQDETLGGLLVRARVAAGQVHEILAED